MRIPVEPAFGTADEVNRAFSHPAFMALKAGGSAFVLVAGDPLRVIWANRAAGRIFGTEQDAALATRLFSGPGPAQRRLRFLATEGAIGGAPRMERLRFVRGLTVQVLTALWVRCSGHNDRPLFGLALVAGSAQGGDALNASASAWREGTEATRLAEPVATAEPVPDAIPAEVEAPMPPVPSFQQKAIAAFGGAETLRFRWRTDAADALASIDDAIFATLCADVPQLGTALADAVAVFDAEGAARLRHDLAKRVSWSGLDLSWPADGGASLMPVVLGGSPVFDADRRFGGFRGFGLIRLGDIMANTAERVTAKRVTAEPLAIAAARDIVPQAVEAPPPPPVEPVAAAESPPPAEPDSPSPDDPQAGGKIGAGQESLDENAPRLTDASESPESPDLLATPFFGVNLADSPPPADIAPPASLDAVQEEPQPAVAELEPAEAPPPVEFSPLPASAEVAGNEAYADTRRNAVAAEVPPQPLTMVEALRVPTESTASIGPAFPSAEASQADPPISLAALSSSAVVGSAANVVRFRPVHGLIFSRVDAAAEDSAERRPPQPEPEQAPQAAIAETEPKAETLPAVASLSPSERFAFDAIARALAGSDDPRSLAEEPVGVLTMLEDTGAEPQAAASPAQPAEPIAALAPPHVAEAVQAPVALLVCRDGRPLLANKALLRLLGFDTFAELAGSTHPLFAMPDGSLEDGAAAPGALCPVVLHDRSGGAVTLTGTAEPVDWNEGAATLWTLTASPAAAAAALPIEPGTPAEASQNHRDAYALLDAAGDALAILDEAGRIRMMNKVGCNLFGSPYGGTSGDGFATLLASESQSYAAETLAALRGGTANPAPAIRDVAARRADGSSFPLRLTLGRLSPTSFYAAMRDISDLKRTERDLAKAEREAERASGRQPEFLAKVSHEIRTPLNAILGFAEVMMDERFGPLGNARYKDYLKDIHVSGTQVMSLVNDLLDLSRIEAGRLDLDLDAIDINKIIADSVAIMQPQAYRERVIMRTSLSARLPRVLADDRTARQIVLNLLSNAVKFNEPGGQVIVSTALNDASGIAVRIRDTGIGMSDGDIAAALEPFRQLASSKSVSGTGLGLPLTKALIGANGATMSIRSRPKEGTLVEVIFAAAAASAVIPARVPA